MFSSNNGPLGHPPHISVLISSILADSANMSTSSGPYSVLQMQQLVYGARIITHLFLPDKCYRGRGILRCVHVKLVNHGHGSGIGVSTKYFPPRLLITLWKFCTLGFSTSKSKRRSFKPNQLVIESLNLASASAYTNLFGLNSEEDDPLGRLLATTILGIFFSNSVFRPFFLTTTTSNLNFGIISFHFF